MGIWMRATILGRGSKDKRSKVPEVTGMESREVLTNRDGKVPHRSVNFQRIITTDCVVDPQMLMILLLLLYCWKFNFF